MEELETKSVKVLVGEAEVISDVVVYTSHSFNQFVQVHSEGIAFVDHGDAYP